MSSHTRVTPVLLTVVSWFVVLISPSVGLPDAPEQDAAAGAAAKEPQAKDGQRKAAAEAKAWWKKGFILVDGRWVTRQEAAEAVRQDKRLADYRKLRDTAGPCAAEQAAVARWCKRNKMPAEERVHWLAVLYFQPNNPNAIKWLDLHLYKGLLLTNAQLTKVRSEAQAWKKALDRWRPVVVRWIAAIESHDGAGAIAAENAVRKAASSADMLALDRVIWQQIGSKKEKTRTNEALSLALVSTLKDMPQQPAVESLVRFAVFSPSPKVLDAAVAALKERRLDRFVPLLISAMAEPIEESTSNNATRPGETGTSCCFVRLTQGLPLVDVSVDIDARADSPLIPMIQQATAIFAPATTIGTGGRPNGAIVFMLDWQHDETVCVLGQCRDDAQSLAARESVTVHTAVLRMNKAIELRNQRIDPVLMATTGQPSHMPIGWWQWWQKYTDAFVPSGDGSSVTTSSSAFVGSDDYYRYSGVMFAGPGWHGVGQTWCGGPLFLSNASTTTVKSHPSTYGKNPSYDEYWHSPSKTNVAKPVTSASDILSVQVWTLTGFQAINTIKPGDRVLSQDPDTGELAFKPVLAVSYRPPSRRTLINVKGEKLATTLGHPFWVAGEGWRMAKELKAGSRLHAMDGEIAVERVVEVDPAAGDDQGTYDLMVADFETYFIGQHLLLVHDGTPPAPTAAILPGVIASAVSEGDVR